jgi:hypothetical protein
MNLGVIAEDDSDVEVLREITLVLLKPQSVGFKKFVGDGCGKVRRKCGAWAANLARQGCRWLVVVHDLDMHNEKELRSHLTNSIANVRTKASIVLIPKREIEAWLLYDGKAIASAFREAQPPPLPGNPESLSDPKKHLRDLIWRRYGKRYLNTVHNPMIAKHIKTSLLKGSLSFKPHFEFVRRVKENLQ